MGYSRSSPRRALAAARRARAGGVMLSAVPACTSSGQKTREANLIGRLNATPSAVRAHTSLRQLGPVMRGIVLLRAVFGDDRARARFPDHRNKMRRASRQPSNRITQTVPGHAEQLECTGVASELREHRHTVHRRGHRHHCRDAAVLGGDADDMTAGERDPHRTMRSGSTPGSRRAAAIAA